MTEAVRGDVRALGALAVLSAAALLYVTSEALPIGLLLHMSTGLGVSETAIGLLVTSYAVVVVVATIPLVLVTRRVPRRPLLCGLLAVFVLTTVMSALAPGYGVVLAARVAGALSQALFWALVVPTAAGMFPPHFRGRAVAVVFAGATVATVLGVPVGTWLGDVAGWRSAFLALAALGTAVLIAAVALLPSGSDAGGHAARGTAPDAGRYALVLAVTVLATTGAFVAYTYVAPFLTQVSGFTPSAVGPVLLFRGATSVGGVVLTGLVADRHPWPAMAAPVALQAIALVGLAAFGDGRIVAVGLLALAGLSFAALTAALGPLVLELAPGRSDLASGGSSVAVNVGIMAGALVGGLLLPQFGVRSTALAGGLLSMAALAVAALPLRLTRLRRTPVVSADTATDEGSSRPDRSSLPNPEPLPPDLCHTPGQTVSGT